MNVPMACEEIDNTFGPYAGSCRGGFDFTLLFQEAILSILPLGIFVIVAALRIHYLWGKSNKVGASVVVYLKTILYTCYSALQLALVVLWTQRNAVKTRASIPNAALALVGSFLALALSFIEHQRTIRPSFILNTYLLLTLLFDVARVRTLLLQRYNVELACVSAAAIAVKAVLVILEAIGKRTLLLKDSKIGAPEALSGAYSRLLFWWLNRLFKEGYSEILSANGLPSLDDGLLSAQLHGRFEAAWKRRSRSEPRSLFKAVVKALAWPFLYAVPFRLGLVGLKFCQPFLVNQAVKSTQGPITKRTTQDGWGLVGAYFLVYCGIAITTCQYQHLTYRVITMARGGLVSMLFARTFSLEAISPDPASSLTLMSADIERISTGWAAVHDIWGGLIEIAVAIYLIELQLGAACAIPLAVGIVSFLGSTFAMSFVISKQALWLRAMEKRISATTRTLSAMKSIKMCGLTQTVSEGLQSLRLDELEVSKKFRRLLIANLACAYITPIIAPVITFTVFSVLALRSSSSTTLTTTKAFTSLSLFALLADPLSSIIMALTLFAGSVGCFDRIQAFLNQPVHVDQRAQHIDFLRGVPFPEEPREKERQNEAAPEVQFHEKESTSTTSFDQEILCIKGSDFSYKEGAKPVLKSIDVAFPQGKLTLVVGPVGCGKTTLLKGLLGEVLAVTGTVKYRPQTFAYCDQTPFHMTGTIRENIVALGQFEPKWYHTVVRACALEEDLRQMPLGDQTRVGTKGMTLSGGQSQRIAIARAVYARNKVCFLDDVFSGLDLDTENHVFHSLLGVHGVLRYSQTTTIVTTSMNKRLPLADHIVVLDKQGGILEQGTFAELNVSNGYVASLGLPPACWDSEEHESEQSRVSSNATENDADTSTLHANAELTLLNANRQTGDLAIYGYYAKSVGWLALTVFIVGISGYAFGMSFPQIWLGWWAAANVETPNQRLGYYLGIYALLSVGTMISLVASCWQLVLIMVPQSGGVFHLKLLRTTLNAPLSFFATTDIGTTINRFSQDLQLIDMDLPLSALNFFAALALCVAQAILLGVTSRYAAISFPFWAIALYLIQRFYLRTSRQLRYLDIESKSPLYTQFTEVMTGLVTVRAFGWQRKLEMKSLQMLDTSQRPFYLLYAVQRWLQLVLDLFVAGVAVMVAILTVELRGIMSGADVGIALLNIILFGQTLKLLFQFWTMMETHIGAITRIKNFSENTSPEDQPGEKSSPPIDWPSSGAIEFRSVSASYDGSHPALKDLSLSIRPSEKVGICGRTGSGKSSTVLSIFRMIEILGGTLTIDDVDISTLSSDEVRLRVIGLPQDTSLFVGTVRLNLDPFKRSSSEEIFKALEDVGLRDTIQEQGGLDAEIDSMNFSNGQKKLLSFVQAMLRTSSILVLDEATSGIDEATDARIQKIIRTRFSRHTIISVAHKLETIAGFDKVVVLDDGSLKEVGDPKMLLQQPASAFYQLYNGTH